MQQRKPEKLRTQLTVLLAVIFSLTLLSPLLPNIALDTAFADAVVRLTDTATVGQLPYICLGLILILISRPGLERRRRGLEAGVVVAVMLVALAGNGLLNEHVVKPLFGVPRPNIVALADSGALGSEFNDAEAFYDVGDKDDRREVLGRQLPVLDSPALSPTARAHWIHETGYAFPSGHATAAITLAVIMAGLGFLWLEGWRQVATTVVVPIWAVAIVYSRPLLDVHTAIDVIGGATVGFVWGLVAFVAVRRTVDRFA